MEDIYVLEELEKIIVAIVLAILVTVFILIFFFYFSRRKILEHKLAKKDLEINHQKNMLRAVVFTQEEERKRIAQDLHDDISSKLNVVSLNSYLLKTPNLTEEERFEITENIIQLSKNALENSRRIAHDLLPPVLEKFGLNSGIEELVADYNSTKVVTVMYKNSIDFSGLEFNLQLHIFRILQELLNNSIRHGKAKNVSISFYNENDKNHCVFKDDGIGFDSNSHKVKKGLGLRNIESRVEFLNGTIRYNSSIGNGVTVVIKY